jgi:hypothetical protein
MACPIQECVIIMHRGRDGLYPWGAQVTLDRQTKPDRGIPCPGCQSTEDGFGAVPHYY